MINYFKEELYDRVFYYGTSKATKTAIIIAVLVTVLPFLFLLGLYLLSSEKFNFAGILSGVFKYFLPISLFFLVAALLIRIFTKKRLMAGINKEGIFVRGVGWIRWNEVSKMEIRRFSTGNYAEKCIYFVLRYPEKYWERASFRKILGFYFLRILTRQDKNSIAVIMANGIDLPIEEMLAVLESYHKKGQN